MTTLLQAIGFVLVAEGLIFALAPARLEEILALLVRIPVETRRLLGLGALAGGVVVLWLVRLAAG